MCPRDLNVAGEWRLPRHHFVAQDDYGLLQFSLSFGWISIPPEVRLARPRRTLMMQQADAEFKMSDLGLHCGLLRKPGAGSAGLHLSPELTVIPR